MWLLLFIYIKLTVGERNWGDITQGMLYRVAVSVVGSLIPRKESDKFWRCNLLVLVREHSCIALVLLVLV
jgi:hypothetical protein